MGPMSDAKARSIEYADDEEHILRRLAGALIVRWSGLPQAERDAIVRQAALMADRDEASGMEWLIETFVADRQPGSPKQFK